MRRAKSRRAEERDQSNRARARYTRGKGKRERERERKYTSDFSLTPFFLLFFFKGVVVCLTFSLFFAQIFLGAQIEALESFTKREIPQRYKI